MLITRAQRFKNFLTSIKLGFFLAYRQVKGSSIGTTALIVFIMTLTFLNLVVVRGVLVGLIQSSTDLFREKYAGDIFISTLPKKTYIENSPSVVEIVKNMPWTKVYSVRYVESGTVEGTYKERIDFTEDANIASGVFTGIDPVMEQETTDIESMIIAGSMLTTEDTDSILIGANTLKKYLPIEAPGLLLLENVDVGSRVRIKVNGNVKEVTIKGIIIFLYTKTDRGVNPPDLCGAYPSARRKPAHESRVLSESLRLYAAKELLRGCTSRPQSRQCCDRALHNRVRRS